MGGKARGDNVSRAYPEFSTSKRQKHRQTTKEVKDRKAAKEQARSAKEKLSCTGLFEDAFELADSLVRNADNYSNRIESSLYGGSNRSSCAWGLHHNVAHAVRPLAGKKWLTLRGAWQSHVPLCA